MLTKLLSYKKRLLAAPLVLVLLLLSGCSLSFNTGGVNSATDGGVFRSVNKGETWTQKTTVALWQGKALDIRNVDANVLEMDPSDSGALYLGSSNNGLFYTYDQGESWQAAGRLGKIGVSGVAVDPSSKCVLYAATLNQVYKSTDCGRFWSQTYFDNDPAVHVKWIAINPKASAEIFIATSRGEVIKSTDGGKTWRTTGRLDGLVARIIIRPDNPDVIFAGTANKGLYRSLDNGESWEGIDDKLKDFKDHSLFRDLVFSVSEPGTIFLANHYGLLRSTDNGNTWTSINLITPKNEATINSLAVSPKNSSEIYYVTNTTFYRSVDGGKNWSSKQLPSSRAGVKLLINPNDPNIIYLGVRKP